MTPEQVCGILSVSHATLKNWVRLGKLSAIESSTGGLLFSLNCIEKFKKTVFESNSLILKRRRNKKMVGGTVFPAGYLGDDSPNSFELLKLAELLKSIPDEDIDNLIPAVCADVISKIVSGFKKNDSVIKYLQQLRRKAEKFETLAADYPKLFSLDFVYRDKEDTSGAVYLVLQRAGQRKSSGAYYTPDRVIKHIYSRLFNNTNDLNKRILDPCCGTGNFLLQLPDTISPEFVFGYDCDEIAVLIARINFALKYSIDDISFVEKHIVHCDFLKYDSDEKFDIIVGNPPWGGEFTAEEKNYIKQNFSSVSGTSVESFSVITEHAFRHLKAKGVLNFLLPQSSLSVKKHLPMRKFILQNGSINRVEYLGELFKHVNCPAVILGVKKTVCKQKIFVSRNDEEWILPETTVVAAESFNFCPPGEQNIIEQMESVENSLTLAGNAEFALGIVTGDNRKHLYNKRLSQTEVVLKGDDIQHYRIKQPENYIKYTPEQFQQCAPESVYRSPEKLFYKFISNRLVFAYDNGQRLSLNSCNIIVPNPEKFNIKYLLAIFNSTAAQFYFSRKFSSVKVLRQHLEQIPIPPVSCNDLMLIIALVDKIIAGDPSEKLLIEQLDEIVSGLYHLTALEHQMLKRSIEK